MIYEGGKDKKRKKIDSPNKAYKNKGKGKIEGSDPDSDFDNPPVVGKRLRADAKEAIINAETGQREKLHISAYPMLTARGSPACLYNAISSLNDVQREAVRTMGFGPILELKINELPSRLAYWVVENFDTRGMEVKLLHGRMLSVGEEDVQRVFGFPNGEEEIKLLENRESTKLYDDWVSLFTGKERTQIRPSDVVGKIKDKECSDGGIWFQRNFLILLAHTLIESRANGYVFPYIMRCLEVMGLVRQWNWCRYVFEALVKTKSKWDDNKQKMFLGPALFLTVTISACLFNYI